MRNRSRKGGILQIGITVAAVIILLAQVGFFDWLGRGARAMTYAVSSAILTAVDVTGNSINAHFAKATAASERDQLRKENQRLHYALLLAGQAERENRALRQLLAFHQSVPVTTVAWGRVVFEVGRAGQRSARIRMPKGWRSSAEDGVLGKLPVVAGAKGLAGRITRIEGRWGEMRALGDSEEVIDLYIPELDLHAVGRGRGEDARLDLGEIPRGTNLPIGTIVLSGGRDGFYPAGLSVGQVTATTVPHEGLYDTVVVQLIQPASSLAEVMLLAGKGL